MCYIFLQVVKEIFMYIIVFFFLGIGYKLIKRLFRACLVTEFPILKICFEVTIILVSEGKLFRSFNIGMSPVIVSSKIKYKIPQIKFRRYLTQRIR